MKSPDFRMMTVRELKLWMARNPDSDDYEEAEDMLHDIYAEEDAEREMYGQCDDYPDIPNCDDWGTGEGRYHGRM